MSSERIKITPAELLAQASEMNALQEQYLALFGNVNSELNKVNSHWSTNLAHNFLGKITGSNKAFLQITNELMNGSIVAKSSAETFESVDSEHAKMFGNSASAKTNQKEDQSASVDMGFYMHHVTDAEYAVLCGIWGNVCNDADPKRSFLKKLKELPSSDPLRDLEAKDIIIDEDKSCGYSAIAIVDNDSKNALVIFAPTNGMEDVGDLITDAALTAGRSTKQSENAISFVNRLSGSYSNIQVTGWSLGGYLATSATLKNSSVSKCVTFDPPGRYDTAYQTMTNYTQVSKATTYEAVGSVVSAVGNGVGHVKPIIVNPNMCGIAPNHGIEEISNSIGGRKAIENTWACTVETDGGGGGHAFYHF